MKVGKEKEGYSWFRRGEVEGGVQVGFKKASSPWISFLVLDLRRVRIEIEEEDELYRHRYVYKSIVVVVAFFVNFNFCVEVSDHWFKGLNMRGA